MTMLLRAKQVKLISDLIQKVKVDVSNFDRKLDTKHFWISELEDCYEWYNMLEIHKARVAMMKLIDSGKWCH